MANRDRATAIRATLARRRTLLGRVRVRLRYDALFSNGRVEHDVNVDATLDGRHLPADACATRAAAEATCSDAGPGRWVEYATGRELDDPPRT
jgi:hypothetical protein